MKGVMMLIVSLRDVNFGFWSHLGCCAQGKTPSYVAHMYLSRSRSGLPERKYKDTYFMCSCPTSIPAPSYAKSSSPGFAVFNL